MTGKITLISPPDVFLNKANSIVLVNTTDEEQDAVSNWFSENQLHGDLNIYFYNNERNLDWLVTAFTVGNNRYINLDNTVDESNLLSSYFLSMESTYYKLSDNNIYEVFRLLNTSRVENIIQFLESVIQIEQDQEPQL